MCAVSQSAEEVLARNPLGVFHRRPPGCQHPLHLIEYVSVHKCNVAVRHPDDLCLSHLLSTTQSLAVLVPDQGSDVGFISQHAVDDGRSEMLSAARPQPIAIQRTGDLPRPLSVECQVECPRDYGSLTLIRNQPGLGYGSMWLWRASIPEGC